MTAERAEQCLEPLILLLRLARQKSLRANRAGRLAGPSGRRLAALIDPAGEWMPRFDSSAHDHPLALLVDLALRLRLVEVRRGRLRLRKRGRRALADPTALWAFVTAAFPFETDDYGREVAHYLLVLTAAGAVSTNRAGMSMVDHLVRSAGWSFGATADEQLNSLHAARTSYAMLRLAAARELRENTRRAGGATTYALMTRNAKLLASAALGAGGGCPSPTASAELTRRAPFRTR